MSIKPFIKVPLVLVENVVFSLFPKARPFIERHLFNPLDFKNDHIGYSRKKFKEFRKYTGPYVDSKDKTLLELGPGGSIGFGLLVLENGSKKYIAIDDGTHTFIDGKRLAQYSKLLDDTTRSLKRYFIRKDGRLTHNPETISFASIDQESRYPLPDGSVDIIYSCAVLEHVHDLDLCFSEMTRVLKDGGVMYHEVDLRDHIFSQESIRFLTMSDFWFRTLFRNAGGYVNRKRLSHYRSLAARHGLEILMLLPTIRYEREDLPEKIRSRYSEEDARVLSFIVVLKKQE
jgi:SAM-dependent methyltransferase